jgi:hypothetical protein
LPGIFAWLRSRLQPPGPAGAAGRADEGGV